MKERPILMSAPMVRAIIGGSKTQTRRVVKHLEQYSRIHDCGFCCPYGIVGDRLWVKETHLPKSSGVIFRADYDEIEAAGIGAMYGGWKPSIFTRRGYSRITLEITGVRVDRLQSISEADAIAEGVKSQWCDDGGETPGRLLYFTDIDAPGIGWPTARDAYKKLWESINGPGSWDLHPWVWVISFRKL